MSLDTLRAYVRIGLGVLVILVWLYVVVITHDQNAAASLNQLLPPLIGLYLAGDGAAKNAASS